MLIALLALFLFGGSGTLPLTAYLDHAKEYAKKEITDEMQRRAVLATIDEMKEAQQEFKKGEEKTAKVLIPLAEHRQTRTEDFQPALTRFFADSEAMQEKLLQLRFRLKSQVNREQWAAAHPAAAADRQRESGQ